MRKNFLNLFLYTLSGVLLLVIGRNVYHHQEKALETAVIKGDDDTTAALLKHGVFPNDPTKLEIMMSKAIKNDETNTMRLLLQHGANLDSALITALDMPDRSNRLNVVKLLLDKGANVNGQGYHGTTLLTSLVSDHIYRKRGLDTVRLLLDQGVNINLRNESGETSLIYAARMGDKEAVKMLLEHGADVNLASSSRHTLLMPPETALEAALYRRHNSIASLLLNASPSQATKSKALNVAVEVGSVEMVESLLAAGARPVPQSQSWLRAVYITQSHSKGRRAKGGKVLSLLCPFGVTAKSTKEEIEARSFDGQTALLRALSQNETQEAQSLLAQGANINVADKQGETPLMEAIEHGSSLIVPLLEKGADPNIVIASGLTPLQQAVRNNNVALVRLLLAHGADPNLHPRRVSILERARKHQQKDMIALLQNAGAK